MDSPKLSFCLSSNKINTNDSEKSNMHNSCEVSRLDQELFERALKYDMILFKWKFIINIKRSIHNNMKMKNLLYQIMVLRHVLSFIRQCINYRNILHFI